MDNIRQTKNTGTVIGVLAEKSLSIKPTEMEINGVKQTVNKITGYISVEIDGGTINVGCNAVAKTKSGEDNKAYKGLETILSEAKDKATHPNDPDTVKCKAEYNAYDSYNKDAKEVRHGENIRANYISRTTDGSAPCADFDIEGVIRAIKPETKDEEPTGRLIVDFVTTDFGGNAQVMTFYVEEKINEGEEEEFTAEGFANYYEAGQTCELHLRLCKRQVGAVAPKKAGIGKRGNTISGYTVNEMVVIGGEPPYEEDDERVFTSTQMKQLMSERDMRLAELAEQGAKAPEKKQTMVKKPIATGKAPF